jgi:2-polyprenyl-3-methyl-5-hydroxy-6-metoxy-1,4-benzoquinol methylase
MSEQQLDQLRQKVKALATEAINQSDPSGWFEVLYAEASGNPQQVPWARLTPHPSLQDWLNTQNIAGDGRRALVIGCGLGDDAQALAERGFEVTAFDISPTAINWCRQRFPHSDVEYLVADLFALDPAWKQAFDLVCECRNIQALPLNVREKILSSVASLVAPEGTLLIITRFRETDAEPDGPPWPLSHSELVKLEQWGLKEMCRDAFEEGENPVVPHLRLVYVQPAH